MYFVKTIQIRRIRGLINITPPLLILCSCEGCLPHKYRQKRGVIINSSREDPEIPHPQHKKCKAIYRKCTYFFPLSFLSVSCYENLGEGRGGGGLLAPLTRLGPRHRYSLKHELDQWRRQLHISYLAKG